METFLQFIVDNWQWFSTILASLFSLILLLIFKKRTKVDVVDPSIYFELIPLINKAEKLYPSGEGKEKLDYVRAEFNKLHPVKLDGINLYANVVDNFVEDILSTPHKK